MGAPVAADGQVGIFGGALVRVRPVASPEPVQRLARALPSALRLGTSSWSYPGWSGLVWDRPYDDKTLARHGLAAYAASPLLRTASLDRTYYGPMTPDALGTLVEGVPEDFRLVVKAHAHCTVPVFPDHPRYGKRRGQENPRYLDPRYAGEEVIGPLITGLGPRLGRVLFQFSPLPAAAVGGVDGFADRLFAFLDGLPKGARYAVELRTPALLHPRVRRALADAGAAACLSITPDMPDVVDQAARLDHPGAPLMVRWIQTLVMPVARAQRLLAPFSALRRPEPQVRRRVARLATDALNQGREVRIIVTNRAEGCAPVSLLGLAAVIARMGRPGARAALATP